MLTALAISCMLGLPQSPCSGPGCSGTGGGFPVAPCDQGWGGGWHHGHHGIGHGLFCHKVPCPLGSYVPCGDDWAMRMHGGIPISTGPISSPVELAPAAPR